MSLIELLLHLRKYGYRLSLDFEAYVKGYSKNVKFVRIHDDGTIEPREYF